jgi:hypothetical protein
MRSMGLEPDPWQIEVLQSTHPRLLLNCSRQSGKSTVVALLGLTQALFVPCTKILLVSRSLRQSTELFGILTDFYRRLGSPMPERQNAHELRLSNFSRVVCLPCREDTIRGFSGVTLLVIDEAARVPDDLYRAARPMLAASQGRLICLSTPYGKRGFFYEAWVKGGDDWARIEVPVALIPRLTEEVMAAEQRAYSESWFRQEYCCSFEALEGLVYPDFDRCVIPALPAHVQAEDAALRSSLRGSTASGALSSSPRPSGGDGSSSSPLPSGGEGLGVRGLRRLGGIDFGFRNPFAALWGLVDRDGILYLTGEHYARNQPLAYHAERLPRGVTWYADPAGAQERCELRCAGFSVLEGDNTLRPGIAAVSARLQNGSLKVVAGRCPNLLHEASMYHYSDDPRERNAEVPVDEYNHALAALRYLISRLDERHMARLRRLPDPSAAKPRPAQRPWLRLDNEALWTRLF